MDEQILQNLKSAIDNNEHVAVLVGKNPTLDQMAAGLSLFLTLKNAKKSVTMLSASEPTVEVGSLVGIDKVETSYSSQAGDLIVSFPYKDGEIEKVAYNEDEEKHLLNIVVTAGENGLSFTEQDVIFARGSGKLNLLITVGTAHLDDVYSVITPDSLTDATIINIDNADGNERYGEINLVSSRFSSLSEQVADLLLTLGYDPEMDEDISQNMMSGIVSGTSNFQNSNTSYLAFEIASILMKKGAKRLTPVPANSQVANEFMSFMQPQKNNNQPQGQNPTNSSPLRPDFTKATTGEQRFEGQAGQGQKQPIQNHPSASHSTLRDESSGSDSKSSGQDPSASSGQGPFASGSGTIKLISYTPNRITFSVSANTNGYAFISDVYTPNWKAKVDGNITPILRADYAFRAIPVQKGTHLVTMSYQDSAFIKGMWLSLMGTILLVGYFAFFRYYKKWNI